MTVINMKLYNILYKMKYLVITVLVVCCFYGITAVEQCGVLRCKPREKCVDTVLSSCEDAACTKYPTCLADEYFVRTCEYTDYRCPRPGYVCVDVRIDCAQASACSVEPRCVSKDSSGNTGIPCGDKNCYGGNICIETVDFDCYSSNCNTYKTCGSPNDDACATIDCRHLLTCVNVQEPCSRGECPITPRCVNTDGGPGTPCGYNSIGVPVSCGPTTECTRVYSCLEERPGCLSYDYCFPRNKESCADYGNRCEYGYECVMVEQHCHFCLPEPTCRPVETDVPYIKPGLCPKLPHNPPGKPCYQDDDCPSDDKCCLLKGAKRSTCTSPVFGGDKPGHCPDPNQNLSSDHCDRDSDCPLSYKCCSNYRDKVCRVPVAIPTR